MQNDDQSDSSLSSLSVQQHALFQQAIKKLPKIIKERSTRTWLGTSYGSPTLGAWTDNVQGWQEYLEKMKLLASRMHYICGQLEECPKTHRLHIQFCVYWENARTLQAMKELDKWAHWQPVFKDNGADIYCMKTETRVAGPVSYGIKPPKGIEKGITMHQCGELSCQHIMDNFTHQIGMKMLDARERYLELTPKVNPVYSEFPFPKKKWQIDLEIYLTSDCDNRKVRWYVDHVGGQGKTTFINWIVLNYPSKTFYSGPGKYSDMIYSLQEWHEWVFLDVPRITLPTDDIYQFIEQAKNGSFTSFKYKPIQRKLTRSPHVIVMSNVEPNKAALSLDRWDIHHLYETNEHNQKESAIYYEQNFDLKIFQEEEKIHQDDNEEVIPENKPIKKKK